MSDERELTGVWEGGDAVTTLNRLIQRIPYARFLGLVAQLDPELTIVMRAQERLVGNPVLRALHGGTLGALLESAAVCGVMWESKLTLVPKTISITIDYLRSGRIEDTRARATITKQGRRVASVTVHAWQENEQKPIAAAHAHLLLRQD